MEGYLEPIKIAILIFPFIALLITFPFMVIQYHKYGSISFFKGFLLYTFILYLICAYFLVILPLPKISEVAAMTAPRTQLIPFSFIFDFIENTSLDIMNTHTYLYALKESYFFVPLYNILLTLPFGIYLRYYFKCSFLKTTLCTFLLSLFFELTQLSGLYFLYPRGYRLFDIDDLILNTVGGTLGYLISGILVKILPNMESVELKTKERGKKISGIRKSTAAFLDFFIFLFMTLLLEGLFSDIVRNTYLLIFSVVFYYFIIPMLLSGQTLALKFLNIKVVDYDGNFNRFKFLLRNSIFILIYIGLPFMFIFVIDHLGIDENIKEFIIFIFICFILLLYVISIIKYVFTSKKMLYEVITKTKLISIIGKGETDEDISS